MLNRLKIALKVAYPLVVAAIKANNPGWVLAINKADEMLREVVESYGNKTD